MHARSQYLLLHYLNLRVVYETIVSTKDTKSNNTTDDIILFRCLLFARCSIAYLLRLRKRLDVVGLEKEHKYSRRKEYSGQTIARINMTICSYKHEHRVYNIRKYENAKNIQGKILHAGSRKDESPLENATESPLDYSSKSPLDKGQSFGTYR